MPGPVHFEAPSALEFFTALVADDRDDPGRLDGLHGPQDVADHASPGDGVEHLHGLRLHAGAAAGGEHDHTV